MHWMGKFMLWDLCQLTCHYFCKDAEKSGQIIADQIQTLSRFIYSKKESNSWKGILLPNMKSKVCYNFSSASYAVSNGDAQRKR